MNYDNVPRHDLLAIKEAVYHWFAFFEGETVSTDSQLDLFDNDIQLVHAGQHLLAKGKDKMRQWLDSVPAEVCSHFVEDLKVERLQTGIYQVSWQTPYQALRSHGEVGGAIIVYQTLIRVSPSGFAQFMAIQKTPVKNNPATVFRQSFSEHRANALCCRLQQWMNSDVKTVPAEINVIGSMSTLLLNIKRQSGNKKLSMQSIENGESAYLLLATDTENYRLNLKQQRGWYPVVTDVVAVN